jgi:NAD(P)-dependent dehydrogenase (short-subunit alcohol dehydrogenase family)
MQRTLEGQAAMVTGGTRGIGRAIAQALLEEGAHVAICGRSQSALDEALQTLRAGHGDAVYGKVADVSDVEQVAALFRFVDEQLGRLNILVNNAGLGLFGAAADLTVEQWREVMGVNLTGAFLCASQALARFRKGGGGYIINISSLAGKNAFAGGAAYNASKSALNALSEATMLDHRYEDVRVTYIMPGSVDTEFRPGSPRADWKIQPEDIASIVLMLLRMPPRTLVSRVEVRPAKPVK